VTVAVLPTAVFDGPCPNLLPDMRCGAYDRRPNACRIYPAEIRPDRQIVPTQKLCPPDAWGGAQPVFSDPVEGIADPVTKVAIDRARLAGIGDVALKARLLARLGIDQVALSNEGYAVWQPEPERLLDALRAVRDEAPPADAPPIRVEIVSPREATRQMIAEAQGADALPDPARGYIYLPLFADEPLSGPKHDRRRDGGTGPRLLRLHAAQGTLDPWRAFRDRFMADPASRRHRAGTRHARPHSSLQ
jgi:hypothetical protein